MPTQDARAEEVARSDAIRRADLEAARPAFDRIAFLVQCFAETPIAQVAIVQNRQIWLAGVSDSAAPSPAFTYAFTAQAAAGGKVFWVEDVADDQRFKGQVWGSSEAAIRFYAGAPIRLVSGVCIGAVVIMARRPRPFDAFLAARLEDFAALVADEWDRGRRLRELKSAADVARTQNRRLSALIDAAPVGLLMTDRELRVLRASPRWVAERGLETTDVVGRRLPELFPEENRALRTGYEAALSGETIRWDRQRLTLPNGSKPWVRGEAAPWRDANGEIGGLLIKSHDITDMVEALEAVERSEHRLSLATEMARLRVWELDLKGRSLKTVGEALAGFDPAIAEQDEALWQVVDPADRDGAKALWKRHLEHGAPFRTSFRVLQADGSSAWVDAVAEAIRDDAGKPERVVGVFKDVDRERRAEQAMARALRTAEAANRAKSEFLANMSHEIRTPLNGVMGIASVLSRSGLNDKQKEMVELIAVSAQTLEGLLSDVLDLARIESGRLELRHEPFNLGEALRQAAALFEAKATDKGLMFKTLISPTAATTVRGDVIRLRQVVSNLLSNAVKFTNKGKVSLYVEAERADEKVKLRLSVIDTGIGFDAETAARLFKRFEQADGSITRKFGGTGLGLAISKSLIDAMGGTLEASSTPGRGAIFKIELTLPCAAEAAWAPSLDDDMAEALALPAPAEPPSAETPEPKPEPVGAPAEPSLRVLLAEDHPTNRKVVSLILEAIGAELTTVANGAEAVETAALNSFDLILMDVQMPVMDGLTAIRHIRDIERRFKGAATPILALTANAMAGDADMSMAAGADGHLTKPIAAETLIAAIQRVRRSRVNGADWQTATA